MGVMGIIQELEKLQNQSDAEKHGSLTEIGHMLAEIGHEIRQPLNIATVIIEGLIFMRTQNRDIDEGVIFEELEAAEAQLRRIAGYLDDINRFVYLSNKGAAKTAVNIKFALESVINMLERNFKSRNIVIVNNAVSYLGHAFAKETALEQIFINLTVNACDAFEFCEKPAKALTISALKSSDRLYLEFEDNATGISPIIIDKIFSPYFTTKEFGKGTGLGLSIVAALLKEMDGDISVSNNALGGCTFLLSIPIRDL